MSIWFTRPGAFGPAAMGPAAPGDPATTLTGTVERVTYRSAATGFHVLKVKVAERRAIVTVAGRAGRVAAGETIRATGAWVDDRRYGLQFRARVLEVIPPTSRAGLERYLGSGLIRGIGSVHAKRLVAAFGDGVHDVIERDGERLREVAGIGPVRARHIARAWADQRVIREITLFLHEHGLPTTHATRIYRLCGPEALAVLRLDPYRLARDLRGVGFRVVDEIGRRLGIDAAAPVRLRAGLDVVLAEGVAEGHCGLPVDELVSRAAALLEAPDELVGDALDRAVEAGEVMIEPVEGRACAFPASLHRAETALAGRLAALARGLVPRPPVDPGRAIASLAASGLTLGPSQAAALRVALTSRAAVVTGGPGVGKTTLVSALLWVLRSAGVRAMLAAPTGRAARRLAEATGSDARTIHRLLEADPQSGGFGRNQLAPLDGDLLVVDEASMVDVPLMRALLVALPARAALLLVGDADQLPSVGPGQVLADVIESGAVPVARLEEVFRHGRRSRALANAHRVKAGTMPDVAADEASDFRFVAARDPVDATREALALVSDYIPSRFGLDPVRDVQVLCPTNRGGLGTRALNLALRGALNPAGGIRVERPHWSFAPGDKVMQVENDYDRDVYNGDCGYVRRIEADGGGLVVAYDGRELAYGPEELEMLAPAYAITIHKSQGSEYPAAVILLSGQHRPMLRRNLLYTAMTRGRRLTVLVGEEAAIAAAVATSPMRRWSRLRALLRRA